MVNTTIHKKTLAMHNILSWVSPLVTGTVRQPVSSVTAPRSLSAGRQSFCEHLQLVASTQLKFFSSKSSHHIYNYVQIYMYVYHDLHIIVTSDFSKYVHSDSFIGLELHLLPGAVHQAVKSNANFVCVGFGSQLGTWEQILSEQNPLLRVQWEGPKLCNTTPWLKPRLRLVMTSHMSNHYNETIVCLGTRTEPSSQTGELGCRILQSIASEIQGFQPHVEQISQAPLKVHSTLNKCPCLPCLTKPIETKRMTWAAMATAKPRPPNTRTVTTRSRCLCGALKLQ